MTRFFTQWEKSSQASPQPYPGPTPAWNTIPRSQQQLLVSFIIVVFESRSWVRLFLTPWTAARQPPLYPTLSQNLLRSVSIELMMPSNYLILCCPLLLLPSLFPSIRVFSNEPALWVRWPEFWSFSFSISPSNDYSGLISFRIVWFDLLALQVKTQQIYLIITIISKFKIQAKKIKIKKTSF